MNRNRAKLLTATGIICVFISVTLIIDNLFEKSDVTIFTAPLLFVGGVVLVTLSLAFYTDR